MYIVRNAPRALLVAVLPLVLYHLLIVALGVLGRLPHFAGSESVFPTPDAALSLLLLRVGLDAALMLVGHYQARYFWVASRSAYMLIGGVAAVISYGVARGCGLTFEAYPPGTWVTAGILPAVFGMMTGFLYRQIAGLEYVEGNSDDELLVPNRIMPRYDGPIRVRTSIAGAAFAAAVPAAAVFVLGLPLMLLLVPALDGAVGSRELWTHQVLALALPLQFALIVLVISALPAVFGAFAIHGLARALKWTKPLEYAGSGATVGLISGLLFFPLSPFTAIYFLVVPSVFIGALMGLAYRFSAGVEPLPLPEPVLVADVDALVPEGHPDRASHQIVLNG